MPRPPLTFVAVSAASVVLALAGVLLVADARLWANDRAAQLLVDAAVGVGYPLAATLMHLGRTLERGARQLALVLLVAGAASAVAAVTTALTLTATDPGGLTGLWMQVQSFAWVPGFLPLLTLVPLLYPDGLLPGRLWLVAARGSVVGIALLSLGVGLFDEYVEGRVLVVKPLTSDIALPLAAAGAAILLGCTVVALASLVERYRRAGPLRRRQVVVLAAAAAVVTAVTAAQGVLPTPADVLLQAGAVLLPPAAIAVAVTRHRLYDLDLAFCRALAVASVSVCLVGAYLTLFALLQALTGRDALSAALSAGLAGVVLQPLGRRITMSVDRLYFGHRAEPYAVTSRLAARLAASGVDVSDVPGLVRSAVLDDLRLGAAELAPADHPVRPEDHAFPLRHRGQTVGWLLVEPRPGEPTLHARDAEVLEVLADQAAPSIAALSLHRDLQRSRERLVAAREEERHRIRHDLHDGLGATLAGLRLQVETAHDLVDHPTAGRLLAAAGESVAAAVAEVRTICEGLRPPGIDDLGLSRALAALGERMDTPDLDVTVRVQPELAVDPAVEVAAYRIAAEALANVVRHSRATHAELEVSAAEGALVVAVRDDGTGVPRDRRDGRDGPGGLGLASMRARAEELGGSLTVGSGRWATEVVATLPLTVGDRT